jgi:hypothetical protein
VDAFVRAGGEAQPGGVTLGGALLQNPEPGGRAELFMTFPSHFTTQREVNDANWTVSRITNGAVMRVKLYSSSQMVPAAALLKSAARGVPFDNGQPWKSGESWAWGPSQPIASDALEGDVSFSIDTTKYGDVLDLGNVIGFSVGDGDFTHVVMDIRPDDGLTVVTVSPPLRRDLAVGEAMLFRPSMLVQCRNAREVMGGLKQRRFAVLNDAHFVEAFI